MPSHAELMAKETSLAKASEMGALSVDGLVLKCPCSGWDPYHVLHKNGTLSKKKSRKHQRFTARRALEQKNQLSHRPGEKIVMNMEGASKVSRIQGSVQWKGTQNRQPLEEDSRKAPKKLDTQSPAPPVLSGEPAQDAASLQDFKDRVTSPGRSATDLGPSSCPRRLRKPKKCVAIDCEMVGTGPSGRMSELARCTVVNYDGDVIYDKYILPELPVVDYRTRWSGITRRDLQTACPFRVAQGEILQILRDKIVVGHAIHNDFRALRYFHPRPWTRDTSQCPLLSQKMGLKVKDSVSLKNLASQLLKKKIQVSKHGHSSVEDAQTSMELYRLVEVPWEEMLASSLSSYPPDSDTDSDCYMDDQYWPEDLDIDCK